MKLIITVSLMLSSMTAFSQSRHERIKTEMKKLEVLIGTWSVKSEFRPRTGSKRVEKGVYEISWALDSTYFEWAGSLKNVESGRERKFISWITFDQSEEAYSQTYMYSKTANQVVTHGQYDSSSSLYSTIVTFELSDGVTEVLRNELNLNNPNRIVNESWASFDNSEEVNNLSAVLTRQN